MQPGEFFEALESAAGANLQVDKTRCVNFRNRNAGCRKCLQACPSGCLGLSEQGAELKANSCTVCGTCAAACPTGALTLEQPAPDELRQAAKDLLQNGGHAMVIACCQAGKLLLDQDLPTLQVPCLGAVDESLLAFIAGEGVSKIYADVSPCDNCNLKASQETFRQTCDNANTIFEAWGSKTRVLMKVEDKAEGPSRAPRITVPATAAKARLSEQAKKGRFPKVGKDGTLPHAVPEKRANLLAELRSWIEPSGETLETSLFGVATIDEEHCSSCRMCTVFCPTGALKRVTGERFGIEHRADICLGCKCCQDICPTGSITISNLVPVSRIAEGDAVFHELEPMENTPSNPHQTLHAIKKMLGQKQIYER